MTGTIDIRLHADHPDEPIAKHYVFAGSPSCPRIVNVPQTIGSWEITDVHVSVAYPDNTMHTATAVEVDGTFVATLPACSTVGSVEGGFQVVADGIDESGEAFEGLCLGVGDLEVLPRMGTISRGGTAVFFHILDAVPTSPSRGDAAVIDGSLKWYDGTAWIPFGGTNVVIDQTLSVSGQAADAKATGDAIAEKRGKTDLDITRKEYSYSATGTTPTPVDVTDVNWDGAHVIVEGYDGLMGVSDDYDSEADVPDEFDIRSIAPAYAGRVESIHIVKTTTVVQIGKLAHVMKDSGGELPSGIAKLGEDGEMTAATPSSTGGANADYRDPKDAMCYETKTKWTTESNIPTSWGEDWKLRYDDGLRLYLLFVGGVNTNARYLGDSPGESDTVRHAQGSGDAAYGPYPERFDRITVATAGQPFVTKDYVDRLINNLMR